MYRKIVITVVYLMFAGCTTTPTGEQIGNTDYETSPTRQSSRTYQYVPQSKWYSGGTLHRATMKEWSRASYQNKLATASDFVIGLLKQDGVDLMTVDIERQIKPMAIGLVKGLDNANKDGLADSMSTSEVAVTIYFLMKSM